MPADGYPEGKSSKQLVAVGLVWLVVVGGTGGQLTYEYGINVRGVNPLLP